MSPGLAWDPVVQAALHAGAAALWLSAAAHKARDPRGFRAALEGYGLLPRAAVPAAAAGLAAAELGLGLGSLVPGAADAAAAGGAALLALYAGAVLAALGRGRRAADCGCGGPGGPRPLSAAIAARNGVLAGLLAVAALPGAARPWTWLDAVGVAGLVGVLALLHAAWDVALANAARLRAPGGSPWAMR